MENYKVINEVARKLNWCRNQFGGIRASEENWSCLESVLCDRVTSMQILPRIQECSYEHKRLIFALIKEMSYIRGQTQNQLPQYIIQKGRCSVLNGIDLSEEALILFGDGAEEIYVYQPKGSRSRISPEIQELLTKLLKERGISIGAAIGKYSFNQRALIACLAQKLDEMWQGYTDGLQLFYTVIQEGKKVNLSDFNPRNEAFFLISTKYEASLFLLN